MQWISSILGSVVGMSGTKGVEVNPVAIMSFSHRSSVVLSGWDIFNIHSRVCGSRVIEVTGELY